LEAYPKVRDAAVRALQLNDEEAEAHVYLAEAKRILDWDLDAAEAECNRAVEIEPNSTPSNYFIAAFYAARGDRDKALRYLQRTSKIDPASLWVNNFACELYRYFGLYDEATAAGERALQLDPRSEEHTSELQSPYDLVCRLLLEKKKKKQLNYIH